MKIHVVSETAYMIKGNGVHTAFVDHVALLNAKNDIEIVVNNEGYGDVFHSHTYGPYYFLKGLFYKHKRVFTAHVIPDSVKGSLLGWKIIMPLVKWYMKQVYSYADVCIAISKTVEEAIVDSGAHTRIERVYNPIPVEKWMRTTEKRKLGRELLGLNEDDFVVLGVGQLQARKGVEDFMDVAAAVPEVKFVWAGGRPFGNLTEGVSRIDKRMEECADTNIQFAGMLPLEEMPLIYAAADMMLFPSYQENCPLAPIEAAAADLPVVFRDLPEYRTLYRNPYLKATTTAGFIQLTRKMISDKAFFEEGIAVSKLLITQFDENAVREKLVQIYRRLCEEESEHYSLRFRKELLRYLSVG
jgi:1,2-diacylglycerol-3-alpha-glucose alpha-1,2-galactosyltransferase